LQLCPRTQRQPETADHDNTSPLAATANRVSGSGGSALTAGEGKACADADHGQATGAADQLQPAL